MAEKISSFLDKMIVKPERQNNFSFNDYSHLGIPDLPFFDLSS